MGDRKTHALGWIDGWMNEIRTSNLLLSESSNLFTGDAYRGLGCGGGRVGGLVYLLFIVYS